MVPLVFKTSLGAVRSPEGSTPSLLRQTSNLKSDSYDFYIVAVAQSEAQNLSALSRFMTIAELF